MGLMDRLFSKKQESQSNAPASRLESAIAKHLNHSSVDTLHEIYNEILNATLFLSIRFLPPESDLEKMEERDLFFLVCAESTVNRGIYTKPHGKLAFTSIHALKALCPDSQGVEMPGHRVLEVFLARGSAVFIKSGTIVLYTSPTQCVALEYNVIKEVIMMNDEKVIAGASPQEAGAHLYQRGMDYLHDTNYDEAVSFLNRAIEFNPAVANFYYGLGRAFAGKGRHNKAVEDFTKALGLDPNHGNAYFYRGKTYNEMGEYDKALEDFYQSMKFLEHHTEIYFRIGVAYLYKGIFFSAMDAFNKAIELLPSYAQAYLYRGKVHHLMNDLEHAVSDMNKAIELDPRSPEAWHSLGIVMCAQERYNEAIQHFSKAIEVDAAFFEAYYCRGIVYADKGLYDEAIEDFTNSLERGNRNTDVYHRRGLCYHQKGLKDSAIRDLKRAAEFGHEYARKSLKDLFSVDFLPPGQEKGRVARTFHPDAESYYRSGCEKAKNAQYEQAIADFTKAIEITPDFSFAYRDRGWTYNLKNVQGKAIEDINKAIELDPQDDKAYYARGHIYYTHEGLKDKAIEDLTRSIELNPNNPEAYSARAVVCFTKNLFDEAIQDFTASIELAPNDGITFLNRAKALYHKGNRQKVKEDLERAKELGVEEARGRLEYLEDQEMWEQAQKDVMEESKQGRTKIQ